MNAIIVRSARVRVSNAWIIGTCRGDRASRAIATATISAAACVHRPMASRTAGREMVIAMTRSRSDISRVNTSGYVAQSNIPATARRRINGTKNVYERR